MRNRLFTKLRHSCPTHFPHEPTQSGNSGVHLLLMIGNPGTGKTLLASRMGTILPELAPEERLQTTRVWSAVGRLEAGQPLLLQRPFRSPQHTISEAGLVGEGSIPAPGEISLAHNGVPLLVFARLIENFLPLSPGHRQNGTKRCNSQNHRKCYHCRNSARSSLLDYRYDKNHQGKYGTGQQKWRHEEFGVVRRQLELRFVLPHWGMLPEMMDCPIGSARGNTQSSAARLSIPSRGDLWFEAAGNEEGRRCSSRCYCLIDQLLRHDLPPLTNASLKCSELAICELARMKILQLCKQRFPRCVWCFLHP